VFDNTVHYSKYSTVQYSTVQYNTAQCSTVQFNIIQHNIMRQSAVQHTIVQYSILYYSTVQYSTAQHSTAQHTIGKHTTLQYLFFTPLSSRYSDLSLPSRCSTVSTMCSNTLGPAMSPLLVTWPMRSTAVPGSSEQRVERRSNR
jgi:hypothetical protein